MPPLISAHSIISKIFGEVIVWVMASIAPFLAFPIVISAAMDKKKFTVLIAPIIIRKPFGSESFFIVELIAAAVLDPSPGSIEVKNPDSVPNTVEVNPSFRFTFVSSLNSCFGIGSCDERISVEIPKNPVSRGNNAFSVRELSVITPSVPAKINTIRDLIFVLL